MNNYATVLCFMCILFLLVRTCFVAPKFSGPKDEPRPASLVHQVDYPLDGGRILRIEGQIRYKNDDDDYDGDKCHAKCCIVCTDWSIGACNMQCCFMYMRAW